MGNFGYMNSGGWGSQNCCNNQDSMQFTGFIAILLIFFILMMFFNNRRSC